jgi:hypothetical protein
MSKVNNILSLIKDFPEQILQGISVRVKQQRLAAKLTQPELT